jgi:hypothetical protein
MHLTKTEPGAFCEQAPDPVWRSPGSIVGPGDRRNHMEFAVTLLQAPDRGIARPQSDQRGSGDTCGLRQCVIAPP